MIYKPDSWCIIRVAYPDAEPHYRVGAGWAGGYTSGRSWQINSGITKYETIERNGYTVYRFHGESGSIYECYATGEGADWYLQSVIDDYKKQTFEAHGVDVFVVKTFDEFKEDFDSSVL